MGMRDGWMSRFFLINFYFFNMLVVRCDGEQLGDSACGAVLSVGIRNSSVIFGDGIGAGMVDFSPWCLPYQSPHSCPDRRPSYCRARRFFYDWIELRRGTPEHEMSERAHFLALCPAPKCQVSNTSWMAPSVHADMR